MKRETSISRPAKIRAAAPTPHLSAGTIRTLKAIAAAVSEEAGRKTPVLRRSRSRCALFLGGDGIGKTLAATWLIQNTHRTIQRIDLRRVKSKYIGETEKNLATIFTRAQNQGWILFFDEADALFGRRTSVKDSHDRYANQEVTYLLDQAREHESLVVVSLRTPPKDLPRFSRKFRWVARFPEPATTAVRPGRPPKSRE